MLTASRVRWLTVGLLCWRLGAAGAVPPEISDIDLARRLNDAFAQVAESVSRVVVVVRVWSKASPQETEEYGELFQFLPEELRERFEREWRRRQDQPRFDQGSGVIIREDGYILTNAHVVENAERIEIRLRDGRRLRAEVRGVDTDSDLAVLKVEETGLPAAKLGESAKVRVGEFAIAIGAPFEFEYSVTFGHVSGTGRRVVSDFRMMDQDFIQTDASINPGNSGGPLVNIEGEVIGINTMIRGLNTGIGFAVPIDLAREVADRLIEHGRFTRAWLGIEIDNAAGRPGVTDVTEGVVVLGIRRDGPSWESGLKRFDVIVDVGGVPVRNVAELKRHISRRPVGKPVTLQVYRAGERVEVTVTPGELPSDRLVAMGITRPRVSEERRADALGLVVSELDADAAARLGIEKGSAVLIEDVKKGSVAERLGIRPGEAVAKLDRRGTPSLEEYRSALEKADLAEGVSIEIVGEEGRRYEILRVEREPDAGSEPEEAGEPRTEEREAPAPTGGNS